MKVLYLETNDDLSNFVNNCQNINSDVSGYSITPNIAKDFDHILIEKKSFTDFLNIQFSNKKNETSERYFLGDIILDKNQNTAYIKKKLVKLSKKEHEILYYFIINHPNLTKKETLFIRIWNKSYKEMSNTLEVHLNRLRKKIGKNKIICIKGFGYKLNIG